MMSSFADSGYEVIGFDGPGQGYSLRENKIPIIYEWEKPVSAILDFFSITDASLIGLSMGGWLCLRAAAFEPRVKRVIASGHAIDYMKSMNPVLRMIHLWFMDHFRGFMNLMAEWKFSIRDGMAPWMVDNLKFITKRKGVLDALEFYLDLNESNMNADLIRQDVLIISGNKDHFIPVKMHDMQIKALTGAKSVTGKVFNESDHAQNHCQIGNTGLLIRTIIEWIESKSIIKPV